MSALTNYTDNDTFAEAYQSVGAPAWANDLDRAMKRVISAIDDGTAASKDAKSDILDAWADALIITAAAIHS